MYLHYLANMKKYTESVQKVCQSTLYSAALYIADVLPWKAFAKCGVQRCTGKRRTGKAERSEGSKTASLCYFCTLSLLLLLWLRRKRSVAVGESGLRASRDVRNSTATRIDSSLDELRKRNPHQLTSFEERRKHTQRYAAKKSLVFVAVKRISFQDINYVFLMRFREKILSPFSLFAFHYQPTNNN